MRMIKSEMLTWEKINLKAEEFRRKYVIPEDLLPVPIENIIEFGLDLEIIPINGLKNRCDIEGFLSYDLKSIVFDNDTFNDPRFENRMRFTLSHEVGHFILHPSIISELKLRDPSQWKDFISEQSTEEISWIERQASQFSGCLLVPENVLRNEITKLKSKINQYKSLTAEYDHGLMTDYVANAIHKVFGVSPSVITNRIRTLRIDL